MGSPAGIGPFYMPLGHYHSHLYCCILLKEKMNIGCPGKVKNNILRAQNLSVLLDGCANTWKSYLGTKVKYFEYGLFLVKTYRI